MKLLSCKLLIMSVYMLTISFLYFLHMPIVLHLQRAIVLVFFIPLKICRDIQNYDFVHTVPANRRAGMEKKRQNKNPDVFVLDDC